MIQWVYTACRHASATVLLGSSQAFALAAEESSPAEKCRAVAWTLQVCAEHSRRDIWQLCAAARLLTHTQCQVLRRTQVPVHHSRFNPPLPAGLNWLPAPHAPRVERAAGSGAAVDGGAAAGGRLDGSGGGKAQPLHALEWACSGSGSGLRLDSCHSAVRRGRLCGGRAVQRRVGAERRSRAHAMRALAPTPLPPTRALGACNTVVNAVSVSSYKGG